jgi:hypothetical protein
LEKENLPGLKTISEKIEENLNIYLKLFVLLYADDTVIMAESQKGQIFSLSHSYITRKVS